MIQQNLLYHCLDASDDRTYYEANHDAAYALIRTGKIMEVMESRFGGLSRDVVEKLLFLGHSKVSDLEAFFGTPNAPTNGDSKIHDGANHANGVNRNSLSSVAQLHYVLTNLLQSGFVEVVTEKMLRSPTDTLNLVERALLHKNFGGQIKGTRQKEELSVKVRQQLKSWRDEGRDWQPTGSKCSVERVNGVNGQGKKRRFSKGGATVDGNHAFQDDGLRLEVGLEIFLQQNEIIY